MSLANLTINSVFRPVTMDDRLKPLLIYQQAYQEQENALAELESQANVWEKLADSAQDEDVYNQYKAYADSVRYQAESIARQGLTPGSRKAMLDLKARYNTDIDPIEKAWTERDRQYKLQQEMMLKDPTHRFRQSANEVGLRNYMNQQYDALTDNFSGAVLEEQASKAAAHLQNLVRNPGELERLNIPFKYIHKIQEGYTPEEINKAINRDDDADPILLNILDSVVESSGVNSWQDERMKREARAFAGRGLYSAVGKQSHQIISDDYSAGIASHAAKAAIDAQYEMEKLRRLGKLKEEEEKDQAELSLDKFKMSYAREKGKAGKSVDKYTSYFTEDGRMSSNAFKRGWMGGDKSAMTPWGGTVDLDFKNFVEKELLGRPVKIVGDKLAAGEQKAISEAWNKYKYDNRADLRDTHEENFYRYALDDSIKKDSAQLLTLGTGDKKGGFEVAEYDYATRTFKPSGKRVSKEDVLNGTWTYEANILTDAGVLAELMNSKGEKKWILMPEGSRKSDLDAVRKNMGDVTQYDVILDILTDPSHYNMDYLDDMAPYMLPQTHEMLNEFIQDMENKKEFTEKDIEDIRTAISNIKNERRSALKKAHERTSQLHLTNKTKSKEWKAIDN